MDQFPTMTISYIFRRISNPIRFFGLKKVPKTERYWKGICAIIITSKGLSNDRRREKEKETRIVLD